MDFKPNDLVRRARHASIALGGVIVFLVGAFFNTQIVRNQKYLVQSEGNRLREVPLAAPRGIIYDRNDKILADNAIGYAVALLANSEDSLRATIARLRSVVDLTTRQNEDAIKRYRRDRTRPTVIFPDAPFDLISVLEEHRIDFPNLIIESAPRRVYPAGKAIGAFMGYIGEISERELNLPANAGYYRAGQVIGKQGLELQYERVLRGREGLRFIEVDARNRPVGTGSAIPGTQPQAAPPLHTNIDLDLQLYIRQLFGDTLVGAAVALVPKTGEILALYSAPSIDPNRFVGGVSSAYYDSLNNDPRRPLYNKALQGQYPPGSTWKLATSVIALEDSVIDFGSHMPEPCTGSYYFGNRLWRCWEKRGHGSLDLSGAIAKSCDVYFYQLGLKMGLTRLVAGGVRLQFDKKTGIDLPEEKAPRFPTAVPQYFNQKYGVRGWTAGSMELNMAIGQGDNAQTVLTMARFYSALATDGSEPALTIARSAGPRARILNVSQAQLVRLRKALMGVVSVGGTAAAAALKGMIVAGKTGTAQTGYFTSKGKPLYDAWFAGFAPADNAEVVVVVMMEHVTFEGSTTAGVATKIIGHYLHVQAVTAEQPGR